MERQSRERPKGHEQAGTLAQVTPLILLVLILVIVAEAHVANRSVGEAAGVRWRVLVRPTERIDGL